MNFVFELPMLVAGIIFAFSFVFWLTSKEEKCWYRRYMLPLMVVSLAVVLPSWWAKLAMVISAALIYDGYQGYGRRIRDEEEEKYRDYAKWLKDEEGGELTT